MIGGVDKVFQTRLHTFEALNLCARSICGHWQTAIIQNVSDGTTYDDFRKVPFASSNEFMIYRDAAAFDCWEQLEADPTNSNTMIHVLSYVWGQATVVVDDISLEMNPILETVSHSLVDASIRIGSQERQAA